MAAARACPAMAMSASRPEISKCDRPGEGSVDGNRRARRSTITDYPGLCRTMPDYPGLSRTIPDRNGPKTPRKPRLDPRRDGASR